MQIDDCGSLQNVGVIRKNFRSVKQKPGRKRPSPGDIDTEHEPEQMERKRQDVEQGERDPEQDAERMEQAERGPEQDGEQMEQAEREPEQDSEQMGQAEREPEQDAEQAEWDWEQMEQIEQQPKYGEKDAEQEERQESIDALERTVNLILSQKSEGSQVNDETLGKALKELECSVVELIDEFESRTKKGAIDQLADISFENIITSTPNSELQKDIRYSLEVWIPADKQKLFHNLNINERNILQSKKGWLNDVIIDSAMNLLHYQFPDLEGFQSCQYAVQLDFERHDKLFIQIINKSWCWRVTLADCEQHQLSAG